MYSIKVVLILSIFLMHVFNLLKSEDEENYSIHTKMHLTHAMCYYFFIFQTVTNSFSLEYETVTQDREMMMTRKKEVLTKLKSVYLHGCHCFTVLNDVINS